MAGKRAAVRAGLATAVARELAVVVGGDSGGRDRDRGGAGPALELDGVEVDIALLLVAVVVLLLRDLDLDLCGTTALIVLDGCSAGSAALDLLAVGAILHLVVELDVLIFVVDGDVDVPDGEVFLVAADFVGELILLDLSSDAFALLDVSQCITSEEIY